MTPFWAAFVSVFSSVAVIAAALQGIKVIRRGKRTTFTDNIWKRLDQVEARLKQEQIDREKETSDLRAENVRVRSALQQFRYRDGAWMETWHQNNVDRVANGMPILQLPEGLRKWPEEITAVT